MLCLYEHLLSIQATMHCNNVTKCHEKDNIHLLKKSHSLQSEVKLKQPQYFYSLWPEKYFKINSEKLNLCVFIKKKSIN